MENCFYRIHLLNLEVLTCAEPEADDNKDLITRFGEAKPDALLKIGQDDAGCAFIPVRNIAFISRRLRSTR